MAEFSKLTVTNKGAALLAKVFTGNIEIEFTKIVSSAMVYSGGLEALTELSDIWQSGLISKKEVASDTSIKVQTSFTNTELTSGYYMRTLGLYAVDPDEGEILYAVTTETTGNCYMPPYNGVTVSGALITLITTVGNAENVSLEVDPAGAATIRNIEDLQQQIDGVTVDITNLQALAEEQQKEIGDTYQQSTGYTDQKIADLINGAPSTLDTLGEIAEAMKDNEDVVTALNEAIGLKANQEEFDTHAGNGTVHITASERENWDGAVAALNGFVFVSVTQAEYDALTHTEDDSTIYIIT